MINNTTFENIIIIEDVNTSNYLLENLLEEINYKSNFLLLIN